MENQKENQCFTTQVEDVLLHLPSSNLSQGSHLQNDNIYQKTISKNNSLSKKKKRFNKALWTLQENLRYASFLQENEYLFGSTKQNRRELKINKILSQYVSTRSPDQCRSHHQKMMKYHTTVKGIINHITVLKEINRLTENKTSLRIRKKTEKLDIQLSVNSSEIKQGHCPREGDLWDILIQFQPYQPLDLPLQNV